MTLTNEAISQLVQLDRLQAKSNLLGFTLFTKPDYEVVWFHKLICQYLDTFVHGDIEKLMLFMPPQHGKTELISRRLSAYLLGLNPNHRILFGTHSQDYAADVCRDIQRIIDTDAYRELFPKTLLNSKNVVKDSLQSTKRTSDYFEIVGNTGAFKAAGAGTGISGFSASMLICDDPYRRFEDAQSPTTREHIWKWYNMDFSARKAKLIVPKLLVHTRWHEDDLAGRILNSSEAKEWTVVSLPALREKEKADYDIRENVDDALWETRHSQSYLMKEREKTGRIGFSAVYQQNPMAMGGNLFKRTDFRYASKNGAYTLYNGSSEKHVHPEDCTRFATVDLATKESETADYTVFCTWEMTPDNDLILIDCFRERVEGANHIDLLWALFHKYHHDEINVESVAYQISLVQMAASQGLPVKELKAHKDKKTRALPAVAKFEAHKVYFLDTVQNLFDIENELTLFPNAKHDDIVDCFGYAAARAMDISTAFYVVPKTIQQPEKTTNFKQLVRQL